MNKRIVKGIEERNIGGKGGEEERTEDRLGKGRLGRGEEIDWERKDGLRRKRRMEEKERRRERKGRKKRGDRTEEEEEEWKKRRV